MRKLIVSLALVMISMTMLANDPIPAEILKTGKASFDQATNTLVLQDGFEYGRSKGLVVFKTGQDLRILLQGNALFKASLVFEDPLIIDSEGGHTLSVVSNISGSAVKCPALTVNKHVKLSVLSRNSQADMVALSCPAISVKGGTLLAEVTTAPVAIETDQLNLEGVRIEKPKAGIVDKSKHCVCFKDGIPAKVVRITPIPKKK